MKKLLIMTAALMLLCTQLYAGNGDLIVGGNLGVGTASPNGKLEIVKDTSDLNLETDYAIRITESTGDIGMLLGVSAANDDVGIIQTLDPGTGWGRSLALQPNGGNVGIGTTNPTTALHIVGTVTSVGDPNFVASTSIGTARVQGFKASNTGGYLISGVEDSVGGSIYVGSSAYAGVIGAGGPAGAPLQFATNNAIRMTITNAGNVGIGHNMTNPQYTLDVAGTLHANNVPVTSDVRFKKDLQPIPAPLSKLLSLNGVSYEWKTDEYKDKNFPEGRHYGVIAQDIEKVLPEVVNTAPDGTKSVAYTEIIPVLIEAMKAQQKEINDLKALVGQLTGK